MRSSNHLLQNILGFLTRRLRNVATSSSGFTLIEMLISVTILTAVVGMFGAGLFQVFGIQRYWTKDLTTTREVRHAGSWLAGDALNATEVLKVVDPLDPSSDVSMDGDALCDNPETTDHVKLTWVDSVDAEHYAEYYVNTVGSVEVFFRGSDSAPLPLTLTEDVVENTITFTLCENKLRATMNVFAERGTVETLDLLTYIRKLDAS